MVWGSFLNAAAALETPTRNGSNAQGANLKFRTQVEQQQQDEDEEEEGEDEAPPPLAPKLSFWSSLRSLGSGLPIGVSTDADMDADEGR